MRWSFHLGRFAGIDLKVHASFLIILVLAAMSGAAAGLLGMAFGVGLVLLVFLCVTLHEFGHSLTAQRFGIEVREIVLLPIGGVAVFSRNARTPVHELLIALAGPAVNVVIAVTIALLLGVVPGWEIFNLFGRRIEVSVQGILNFMLGANVMLALFNMIPAFPLDGGRVLRALLAMRKSQADATRIAAGVGQIIAIGGGLFALLTGNMFLALIAVFVFFAAGAEAGQSRATQVLSTLRAGDAYNKTALTLSIDDRVSRVVDHLLTSYQPDFAVVQNGRLLGIVTREDVLRWFSTNRYDVFVTEVMNERYPRLNAAMPLDEVQQFLAEHDARVAAVFDGDAYLGLISRDDIAKVYAVLAHLNRQENFRRRPSGPSPQYDPIHPSYHPR
jgi:Zn-dependent protease